MQLKKLIVAIALTSSVLLINEGVQAQQPATPEYAIVLESRGIKATMVDQPNISGSYGESPTTDGQRGRKWLEISFEFNAEHPLKGYIEEIKFKISIEGRELHDLSDTEGVPVILTGETTFMNLPAKPGGSKSTGYFFVHPSTLDRFSGPGGADRMQFIGTTKNAHNNNIRIEATVGGQPVIFDPQTGRTYVDLLKDDEKWVEQCKAVPHQVLSKDKSPWAFAWLDSTPLIKPSESAGN